MKLKQVSLPISLRTIESLKLFAEKYPKLDLSVRPLKGYTGYIAAGSEEAISTLVGERGLDPIRLGDLEVPDEAPKPETKLIDRSDDLALARKFILASIEDGGWSEDEFRAEPDHKDMVEWLDRNGGFGAQGTAQEEAGK